MPPRGLKAAAAREAGGKAKRRRTAALAAEPADADESEDEAPLTSLTGPEASSGAVGSRASPVAPAEESDDEAAAADDGEVSDAESDSSSSSSSSSSSGEREADAERGEGGPEKPPPPEPEQPPVLGAVKGQELATIGGGSSSSSSESSDSSSESSDSEGELAIQAEAQSEVSKRLGALKVLRTSQLRREDLVKLVLNLPEEDVEEVVRNAPQRPGWRSTLLRSYVRITVGGSAKDADKAQGPDSGVACVVAEVIDIEEAAPYQVHRQNGELTTMRIQLRCKRGTSSRLLKISSVSNQDVAETEFEQWRRVMERSGVGLDHCVEMMKNKAEHIHSAMNFTFDLDIVEKMLQERGGVEFDSQKESRMRFQVECALSHMDISGIRDHEAKELEERYKDSLDKLHEMEAKSTALQEEWFKKRPNLYSLKMINKKNLELQVRDDRHALDYTLANESAGKEGLNPFQRRSCRPVMAWDTKLTSVGSLGHEAKLSFGEAAPATPPGQVSLSGPADVKVNGAKDAASETPDATPTAPSSRVASILRAHRQANLLGRFASAVATQ